MNVADLSRLYQSVRQKTLNLTKNLSAEDCCVQSMPDASPVKWHLGHTAWFFETFILERWEENFAPFSASFRKIFNSYYQSIGEKHPRPERGLLTRPSLADVLRYRVHVDTKIFALISCSESELDLRNLILLGIHHEQQHQELIQTDIKHLFSCNPLLTAYEPHTPCAPHADQTSEKISPRVSEPCELHWRTFAGGVVDIGHDGAGFAFDNESPRHRLFLAPYRLASRLVTNAEFADFVRAGGYADPGYWLSEGWEWRSLGNRQHPLYWHVGAEDWKEFSLHGLEHLNPHAPVRHVSYFEADAYARWADARLPTEGEWEHACLQMSEHDAERWQMFGSAWQWTASAYASYPGFRPAAGAVGEYNGKFMVNQYVLRGSSAATPAEHSRPSYRNFFPASACWQFTGIRLARDIGADEFR